MVIVTMYGNADVDQFPVGPLTTKVRQKMADRSAQLRHSILDPGGAGSIIPATVGIQVRNLQSELMEALRDNEVLRQAIASGHGVSDIGHRTVSSTQLASASRSTLSAHQRREVADMVRRQENLRKAQACAFEKQIETLQQERIQAEQELAQTQDRCAAHDKITFRVVSSHNGLRENVPC